MAAITIIGSAVIAGDASIAASNQQSKATKCVADAATQAADANVIESGRQCDQSRADFAPCRALGTAAIDRINAASNGDMSGFATSLDYNFVRDEGIWDIGNTFAAKGGRCLAMRCAHIAATRPISLQDNSASGTVSKD